MNELDNKPLNHTYPTVIIQIAIMLINCSGVSFRSVSKIFLILNTSLKLNIRVPSHTTVINWVKKQGVANFRNKDFFESQKWILILDESIQFGNKKLLAVMAVSASKLPSKRALNYNDLVPLVLKSSESWKAEDIKKEITESINMDNILYVVSDNGNNFKSFYETSGLTHIEDIGHKISWIIKEVYEGRSDFEQYTKQLSGLRGKLPLSKHSYLIPPNQRKVSRFMNLTPLFRWGCRMSELLERKALSEKEVELVGFVAENKEFIQRTYALLKLLNKIQKKLKKDGFNETSVLFCRKLLSSINNGHENTVKQMIEKYFDDTKAKMSKKESLLCSSDIIESCFGKYKNIVSTNKTVGITDLCLCISTLLSDCSKEAIEKAMVETKISQIKDWKNENIGETLFMKRNNFYKKTG